MESDGLPVGGFDGVEARGERQLAAGSAGGEADFVYCRAGDVWRFRSEKEAVIARVLMPFGGVGTVNEPPSCGRAELEIAVDAIVFVFRE